MGAAATPESIQHVFFHCPISQNIINYVRDEFVNVFDISQNIAEFLVLQRRESKSETEKINIVNLLIKRYLWLCLHFDNVPNPVAAVIFIKKEIKLIDNTSMVLRGNELFGNI